MNPNATLSDAPLLTSAVVSYAAQECEWQASGEMSVAWMVDGWLYACECRDRPPTLLDVLELGRIVEPRHNLKGLRRVGVRVGSSVKLAPDLVPEALYRLLATAPLVFADPDAKGTGRLSVVAEWFREYEEIHPFRDGNGRTGSLLYNWLRGTLTHPIPPPNLWHDPRRG